MKRQVRDIKLGGDKLRMIADVNRIVDEFLAGDMVLTLRQIYYQFIQRDWFPKSWIVGERKA